MIRTVDLTKAYDGVKAVDSLNLSVEDGDVFGFLGHNGSGKTTTMGMMIGEIEPTSGQCFIKDIDVLRHPLEVKKIIGYMPDGLGFYENLDARQNLKFFSQFYDISTDKADRRIEELLEYVGLKDVDKKTGGYSKGMKQRLGLAQALLNDPDVILMDEPTNGLDPQGVIQVRNIILDLSKQGKTIFFSSHILEEVRHVCKTVGIITKGKLIARGTLDEVRNKMRKEDVVTIVVKSSGAIPQLTDPGIIDASYVDGTAVIHAKSDIREQISDELVRNHVHIKELRMEEASLEDIFLSSVYGGN
jgi:ABC-2 type transport system ATP-binding protein